jgi:arginase
MTHQPPSVQIIGVPLDLGASRRGTDAGPSAMRVAGLGAALERSGCRLAKQIDIPVPSMETGHSNSHDARFRDEILAVCRQLARVTQEALQQGHIPLIIGGDHSLAMGSISGVAAHYRAQQADIGLIWFDAHGDMNTPATSPSGNIHGMPLAHLLGQGDSALANIHDICPTINADKVALIGIRDIDANERKVLLASGIHSFTMRQIDEMGIHRVIDDAIEIVTDGTAGFHLSFDVDGCDPEVIPGSGTLVPGGVNYREAHLLLESCADTGKMLAMDVVELNPFLDLKNVSAERMVNLIQSAFGQSIL